MSQDFRTDTTHEAYQTARAAGHLDDGCRLCDAVTVQAFENWRIVNNRFPYDAVATTHHMLVPTRHVTEDELTTAEVAELLEIKQTALSMYDCIIESLPHNKSIPEHHHIHLVVIKDDIK